MRSSDHKIYYRFDPTDSAAGTQNRRSAILYNVKGMNMSTKSSRLAKTANEIKKRRMIIRGLSVVVLVCFAVFFAVANIINPRKEFSQGENRALKTMPGITAESFADGSFFKEAFDAYSDQFVFRDAFIGMKAQAELLSGDYMENGVIIGKDGYLFATPEKPVNSKTTDIQAAVNSFAKNNPKANVTFILAPCASSVLTHKLPATAALRDQSADINTFGEGIDESVKFINAGDILSEHKDEYIYYRTDHHWTSLGAYYVLEGSAETLGINELYEPVEHKVTDGFFGTMASQSGVYTQADSISIFDYKDVHEDYYVNINSGEKMTASFFDSEKLEEKDKYQVFLGGNHPIVEISTAAGTGKKLMMFKDSYANSFVQLLYPYYDEIIMVDPRYYYEDPVQLMELKGITDVVFLYSGNTLFTDSSLVDCLGG